MQTNEGEVSEESGSKVEQEDFVMEGHGKTPPPGEESKHQRESESELVQAKMADRVSAGF
ncbi:trinucleotide repeat containing adaptor 6B [Phyllostomus discolor]|uniref:Trinucleotide repeat containing adaptor 6B n=1 Tax=Phyllostomus discolor TaxID=89673 RepID=A0A834B4B4_9CHIR|nr:trinucleotide repeat containing adaptor 6B [Phyllostomus discolor]